MRNKTIGQLFREHFAVTVYGIDCTRDHIFDTFDILYAADICEASKQRRIKEGHGNLLSDAIRRMVNNRFAMFESYIKQYGYFNFNDGLTDQIVLELAGVWDALKIRMHDALDCRREQLFEPRQFETITDRVTFIEHPMTTFSRELNTLDVYLGDKRVARRDKEQAELQASLIYLLRAGNAVFQRHEWQPQIVLNDNANQH